MDEQNLILNVLTEYLEAEDFAYEVLDAGTAIRTSFLGKTAPYAVRIILPGGAPVLGVLVRLPVVVPEGQRPVVADAVNRANYGLRLGSFELDPADGMLLFRSAMPIADGTLTREQFRHLLYSALSTTDGYARAFLRLIYGDDLSPAEVIAEVEMAE
jgi:hypothetical protein